MLPWVTFVVRKNPFAEGNLVCALGSLLVTVVGGWGRAWVRFCQWHVLTRSGGWFLTPAAQCHTTPRFIGSIQRWLQAGQGCQPVPEQSRSVFQMLVGKSVPSSPPSAEGHHFSIYKYSVGEDGWFSCGFVWVFFIQRLEHWGDSGSWRIKMRKLSENLGLYSLKDGLWLMSGF